MQAPNKAGELCVLCVAVCPDCNMHSVCDPAWMDCVGETLNVCCDNCCEDEEKPHLILKFIRSPENK